MYALLEYYSVIVSENQHPYVSMHTDYLYALTKSLTSRSAYLNYAVLRYCRLVGQGGKTLCRGSDDIRKGAVYGTTCHRHHVRL